MVKWSGFQWLCFGCIIVLLINMVLVGSALFAFFGLWQGIRVVRRKFDDIDNQVLNKKVGG